MTFPYTSVGQAAPALTPAQVAFQAAVARTQALQTQVDTLNRQLVDLDNQIRVAHDRSDFGVSEAQLQSQRIPMRQQFLALQAQLTAAQQEQARLRTDLPVHVTGRPDPNAASYVSTRFPPGTQFRNGLTPRIADTLMNQRDLAAQQGNGARITEIDAILQKNVVLPAPGNVPIGGGAPLDENGNPMPTRPNYLVPALVVGAALLAGGYLLTRPRAA